MYVQCLYTMSNPFILPTDEPENNDQDDRNPLIIPNKEPIVKGCPICGGQASGIGSNGVLVFTCLNESCKNSWQSGLPRSVIDPKKPIPTTDPRTRPALEINWNSRYKQWEEDLRPVDPTPDFRKGAPMSEEDDWSY